MPTAPRGADKQWTLFFDDIEVGDERLVGAEQRPGARVFDGLNPERIMAAAFGVGAGAPRARPGRRVRAASARCGARRSAPTRAISHPLAEAQDRARARRADDAQGVLRSTTPGAKGAGEASNMAKYAAAEVAIHCVDQAIQTHGGNGVAEEYGLTDMWWGVRTMRIAPVSREMILNYVAEHCLGLPRSY